MYIYLAIIAPILTIAQTPPVGRCPGLYEGTPPGQSAVVPPLDEYNTALATLNIGDVITDLYALMLQSQTCWPADNYGSTIGASYGPLFVRLAWHCSGTFRDTDVPGGGCAGARQRFPPEASWADNTNLDKARALLWPIKQTYGDALSWGDLMIFAGTAAVLQMGGPLTNIEICAGRFDNPDGTLSNDLGPTDEQEQCCPCAQQGNCQAPLGADTIGLIYVNPEGFMGNPNNPLATAEQIREVFGRMDMNDREAVALIGGGHAFGKCHGACDWPDAAGDPPNENATAPWQGICATNIGPMGKGPNTFTSGFEGQWTTTPLTWSNEFFRRLVSDEYIQTQSPGGKTQWVNIDNEALMMLTSDVALYYDANFREIVIEFANNAQALDEAFANAWKKLVENGDGFAEGKKCATPPSFKFGNNTDTEYKKRKQ